jgi:hypothetical protein
MEDGKQSISPNTGAIQYPPLESVTKPTLTTAEYAHYINIKPQTARVHACKECGPLRPRRVGGRLHWSTAETKSLLGVA